MKKILLLFTILTTLTCIGCSKEETMQMSISDSVSESSEENFDTSATVQQLFSEAVTKDNYEMAKWALLNGADVNCGSFRGGGFFCGGGGFLFRGFLGGRRLRLAAVAALLAAAGKCRASQHTGEKQCRQFFP